MRDHHVRRQAGPHCLRRAVLPANRARVGLPRPVRIICGRHWRLGDATYRRRYFRARRKGKHVLARLCWERIRTQAIERSAGVTS